jgi:hypothetical protein
MDIALRNMVFDFLFTSAVIFSTETTTKNCDKHEYSIPPLLLRSYSMLLLTHIKHRLISTKRYAYYSHTKSFHWCTQIK